MSDICIFCFFAYLPFSTRCPTFLPGNLAKDDRKTKVLTTAGLSKVFDQGFRCVA